MSEEHQVNLFARYEQRLLSGASTKQRVIPAVIITGFLGSGKTTLVQHVLRNRGSLRIAVLVNEVGQVDVDSELVNAKQGNAALGLTAADLSGGCVCCSRADDLAEALRRIREPTAAAASGAGVGGAVGAGPEGPCDYLLVETSGAADAGPLAEALVAGGFRLDAVVAVVDAEAGREALRHPVARAQIECADAVVLNKCDLVTGPPPPPPAPGVEAGVDGGGPPPPRGLGALADLEDTLGEMAPGVRVVRARFGEVPLTVVLDVEPVGPATPAVGLGGAGGRAAGGDDAGTAASSGDSGAAGFMSHEAVPVGGAGGGYRLASGPLTAEGLAVGSSRHTARRATVPPSLQGPKASAAAQPAAAQPQAHPHSHKPPSHHHHHQRDDHLHTERASAGGGRVTPGAPAPPPLPDTGPAGTPAHAHLHSGFHTESVVVAERPCSLLAFADFVGRHLVREPALLRSKGVMWFAERRTHRFTVHFSGRRRVEAAQEGPWEGPPATQLVLIGTDAAVLRGLRDRFLTEVLMPPPPSPGQPPAPPPATAAAGIDDPAAAQQQQQHGAGGAVTSASTQTQVQQADGTATGARGAEVHGAAAGGSSSGRDGGSDLVGQEVGAAAAADRAVTAAEAAAVEIAANERLQLLDAGPWMPAAVRPEAGGEGGTGSSRGGHQEQEDCDMASAEAVEPGQRPQAVLANAATATGPSGHGAAAGEGAAAATAVEGGLGAPGISGGSGSGSRGLLHLTVLGSALHGINGEELNAELMRRANATGRLLLVGVTAPGKISAATNVQSRERVLSLLLPLAAAPLEAAAQARALVEAAEPLLRRAYAHVHNCKCDVAGAMQQGGLGAA